MGSNEAALAETLRRLSVSPELAAVVELAACLARAVDESGSVEVAREYRMVLKLLMEATRGGVDDSLERELDDLRGGAAVRD